MPIIGVLQGYFAIMTAKNESGSQFEGEESLLAGDPRWEAALRAAQSSQLARAAQLQSILLFIVRQAIQRPEEQVHEFDIAYRVLGRSSNFNPLDDNIVRVQIARLRKKLDLYFSTEGENERLIISVALGSYRPVFVDRIQYTPQSNLLGDELEKQSAPIIDEEGTLPDQAMPTLVPDVPSTIPRRFLKLGKPNLLGLICLALACACVALGIYDYSLQRSLTPWKNSPSVAALWSGFLDAPQITDVVMEDSAFLLLQNMSKQTFSMNEYANRFYLRKLQGQDFSPEIRSALQLVAS